MSDDETTTETPQVSGKSDDELRAMMSQMMDEHLAKAAPKTDASADIQKAQGTRREDGLMAALAASIDALPDRIVDALRESGTSESATTKANEGAGKTGENAQETEAEQEPGTKAKTKGKKSFADIWFGE